MKKFLVLLVCLVFTFSVSCFEEDEETPDPQSMNSIIPPESTMKIDFSSFNAINSQDKTIEGEEAACWLIGSGLVLWGNLVCFLPLAVPSAIFAVLREQIPTTATPDLVEWSYSFSNDSESLTVVVTAEKKGGEYDWEWSFTVNDFEWITGGSMEDSSRGWWEFHDNSLPADSDEVIQVEWTYTDEENSTVTFTNVNENDSDGMGDYIKYTRVENDISVRFHDVHDNGGDLRDIEVYWDIVDHTGGITVHEGDGEDCTWDPED